MVNLQLLRDQLINEEGIRFTPYTDTRGKVTIGVGHNLTDNGISQSVMYAILQEDINEVISDLDMNIPFWKNMDEVRQRALADVCFNIGIVQFLNFHKMISALVSQNYAIAAYELKTSAWYGEVGARGPKLVNMLLLGVDA